MKEISVDLNRHLLRSVPFIHFVSLNGTVRKLNSTATLYDAMAFVRLFERGIFKRVFSDIYKRISFHTKGKEAEFSLRNVIYNII